MTAPKATASAGTDSWAGAPPYVPLWPKGRAVTAAETDPTDHVRGVRDGMTGVVCEADRGSMVKRGRKWERDTICCPQVEFAHGEKVWMGLHQLRPNAG